MQEEKLINLIIKGRAYFYSKYGKPPKKIFMHPHLIYLLTEELRQLPHIIHELDYQQPKQICNMDIIEVPEQKFVYFDKEIEPLPMSFGL